MFENLKKWWSSSSCQRNAWKPPRYRPNLERLEERNAPAVFTVNTVADTQDAMIGDGLARDAMGNTSLRGAIEEGNASADANVTINFDAMAIHAGGGVISLGIALPTLTHNFTINGFGASSLTIQRNPAVGAFRVFYVSGAVTVNINELTIANGLAQATDMGGNGGGLLNNGGWVTLTDLSIHDNQAENGGAVANATGTILLQSCSLYYNSATVAGGAIYNGNGQTVVEYGTDVFANSAFAGGGAFNAVPGTLNIEGGSAIHANTATRYGGGIYSYGQLNMSYAGLYNNSVTDAQGWGGGLYSGGTSTLQNVSIMQNHANGASGKGGGLYVTAGTTTLDACTISGNTCGLAGGGTGAAWATGSTLTITNSTITDQIVQDMNP